MFKFFLLLTNDKQFQPVSHSVRLLYVFSAHCIWDSGNRGWKRYSHVILGNQSRSMFVLWSSLRKPCLTQISILKRC